MRRPILLAVGVLLLVAATGQSVLLPERPVTLCSVVAGFSGRLLESLIVSALPLSGSRESVRTETELIVVDASAPEPSMDIRKPTVVEPVNGARDVALSNPTPLGLDAVWLNGSAIHLLASKASSRIEAMGIAHDAETVAPVGARETCTG